MFGSSILDVAIGMVFIFLLLSLIASAAQETLSSILQIRAANLERGIRSLFSGGTTIDQVPFVDLIYNHGLVRGLFRDPGVDSGKSQPPSRKAIAAVVQDRRARLANPENQQSVRLSFKERLRALFGVNNSELKHLVEDPFLLPAYIPSRVFAMAVMDALNTDKQTGEIALAAMETILQKLCAPVPAVDGQPKPPCDHKAAEAMLAMLVQARNIEADTQKRLNQFQTNLESWYNDAMDRVSGWYKKYTQNILLVIGLVLAIAFNVDSIHIARTLWFDRDLRSGLVSSAREYTTPPPSVPSDSEGGAQDSSQSQQSAANAPASGDAQTVQQNGPSAQSASGTTNTPSEAVLEQKMKDTITAFNHVSSQNLIPVGWSTSPVPAFASPDNPVIYLWRNKLSLAALVVGWLITALAISLGAPFWFDMLNKFMVVRSTIKPQEKSKPEASKG